MFFGMGMGVLIGFVIGVVVSLLIWDSNNLNRWLYRKSSPIQSRGKHKWLNTYYCPRCKIPLMETDDHKNGRYEYLGDCKKCGRKLNWALFGIEWEYDETIYSNDGEE